MIHSTRACGTGRQHRRGRRAPRPRSWGITARAGRPFGPGPGGTATRGAGSATATSVGGPQR